MGKGDDAVNMNGKRKGKSNVRHGRSTAKRGKNG